VNIGKLGMVFSFDKNEFIHTELSKKYSLEEVDQLASNSGFKLKDHILDSNEYFAECILEKV
jgi:uncharacterized SAM-dependent methyltransferase